MTTQPEALRLATALEKFWAGEPGYDRERQAAAELRRLHAELAESEKWRDRDEVRAANAEKERDIAEAQRDALLAALRWIDKRCPVALMDMPFHIHREMAHDAGACARAAIKAVEGK